MCYVVVTFTFAFVVVVIDLHVVTFTFYHAFVTQITTFYYARLRLFHVYTPRSYVSLFPFVPRLRCYVCVTLICCCCCSGTLPGCCSTLLRFCCPHSFVRLRYVVTFARLHCCSHTPFVTLRCRAVTRPLICVYRCSVYVTHWCRRYVCLRCNSFVVCCLLIPGCVGCSLIYV